MNEEEKKAIKELIEIKELVEEDLKYDDYEVTATLDQIDLKSLVIVLNLIEKQQKEIDLLKDQKEYVINEYGRTIEKKDKKIEELKDFRKRFVDYTDEDLKKAEDYFMKQYTFMGDYTAVHINTLLKAVSKLNHENIKKDKIIDLMAEKICFFDIDLLASFDNEIQCVEYFTKKAEE